MLTLSRKLGERIIIGDGESKITVEVVDIQGNRVRVGVTAPKDVVILREELAARGRRPDADNSGN